MSITRIVTNRYLEVAKKLKWSFVLGVLSSVIVIPLAMSQLFFKDNSTAFFLSNNSMYIIYGTIIAAGLIGILGATLRNKFGGVLMIVAGLFLLLSTSILIFFPGLLVLASGVIAFRDNSSPEFKIKTKMDKISLGLIVVLELNPLIYYYIYKLSQNTYSFNYPTWTYYTFLASIVDFSILFILAFYLIYRFKLKKEKSKSTRILQLLRMALLAC